jgi:hypothetical protein
LSAVFVKAFDNTVGLLSFGFGAAVVDILDGKIGHIRAVPAIFSSAIG